jgi:hypothetical protein
MVHVGTGFSFQPGLSLSNIKQKIKTAIIVGSMCFDLMGFRHFTLMFLGLAIPPINWGAGEIAGF